ncbi:MAG: FAD-dependent oxidoreductase [Phycisphaerae bacterium]
MLESYWRETTATPPFPQIDKNLKVDVAIIGGGITGITLAYLMKRAGRTVALLERNRCAWMDTGHTTAHLTCVTDMRLSDLAKDYGADHAGAVWDAGLAAIDQIEEIIGHKRMECEFRRVPGFLCGKLENPGANERDYFENETLLATRLGFNVAFVDAVPLFGRPGMMVAGQAKFHPQKYLASLLQSIPGGGSHVFEHSPVEDFVIDPPVLKSHTHTVTCDNLVIATHYPIAGLDAVLRTDAFETKLATYTSYVIGARLPTGRAPEALFWDTSDPYFYLRVDRHPTHDYLIFGGEDRRTGQEEDEASRYERLEDVLQAFLPEAEVDCRWSGRVVEPMDGLPYIGELAPHCYVATGFAGQGMTFGTLSAMMIRDAIFQFPNPWKELFSPQRKKIVAGAWDYLKENLSYPYYMLKDRLLRGEGTSLREVAPGEGKILSARGGQVAVYRDEAGKLTTMSPVCTHLGCIVHWNRDEKTWDCPCHGSRYKCTGDVLSGPAEKPLRKVTVEEKPG